MARAARAYLRSSMTARAKTVSGVEKDRAVMYGSMRSRPVLVAGMARTAVMTSMPVQRAGNDVKQARSKSQHDASMAKRVRMYQEKMDQSMGRWVRRDVQARMGPN